MPPTVFATPLPQSPRSSILEYAFPAPFSNLTLTGRSRAAWHTSFVVPQLNLLLDAGLVVNSVRPKHIFLTHGHSDHVMLAPAFMKRDDPPDVVCPVEMADAFEDYVLASTILNRGGLVGVEDAEVEGLPVEKEGENGDELVEQDEAGGEEVLERKKRSPSEKAFLNHHITHAVRPGDTIPFARLPAYSATAFACDHNVPSIGYLFTRTTNRLNPSYASLPPAELSALKRSGTAITVPHTVPVFAFLGDGTATTLLSEPQWLKDGVRVVITECSFLREEHRAQAEKTKHTHWGDLEAVVRRWPETMFVLTHFSLRYSEKEVAEFFGGMEDCPANIVVWADVEG